MIPWLMFCLERRLIVLKITKVLLYLIDMQKTSRRLDSMSLLKFLDTVGCTETWDPLQTDMVSNLAGIGTGSIGAMDLSLSYSKGRQN